MSVHVMAARNYTIPHAFPGLECIQNFTRAELMRDPAAQLETSMREVLVRQMGKLKESLLGEDGEETLNLKEPRCQSLGKLVGPCRELMKLILACVDVLNSM